MKVTYGIWEISQGKGDRMYIECSDESKIMHPELICEMNGLGMYGYNYMQDLAIAILKFEKALNESNSIISKA